MIQPGLYGETKLLGAKVKIISSPAYDLFDNGGNDKTYILKQIDYRIALDGKITVGFILDGLSSHYSPGDLEIVELPVCNK